MDTLETFGQGSRVDGNDTDDEEERGLIIDTEEIDTESTEEVLDFSAIYSNL